MPWKNNKGKNFLFGAPYFYEKKRCGGRPNIHEARCAACMEQKPTGECTLRKKGWICKECA